MQTVNKTEAEKTIQFLGSILKNIDFLFDPSKTNIYSLVEEKGRSDIQKSLDYYRYKMIKYKKYLNSRFCPLHETYNPQRNILRMQNHLDELKSVSVSKIDLGETISVLEKFQNQFSAQKFLDYTDRSINLAMEQYLNLLCYFFNLLQREYLFVIYSRKFLEEYVNALRFIHLHPNKK
jgi:hypothetical protein